MKTSPTDAVVVRRGPLHCRMRPSVWKTLRHAWRKLTSSGVAPTGPAVHDIPNGKKLTRGLTANISKLHRKSVVAITLRYLSFRDAFGVLGPPMVVVALVCISWTGWLIVLTVAPNQTANYLMSTGGYDDGQFWLIPEKLTTLQIFSVVGLVVVATMYLFVLLKMLVWRVHRHAEGTFLDRILQRCAPDDADGSAQLDFSHRVRHLIWQLYTHFKELTGFRGKYRKLWNLCLKAFDLLMQTLVLGGLLEAGTPVLLTLGYAVFIALNAFSCALAILSGKHSAFAEILVDSLFDLNAAVLFPILVLVYCAYTFDYDHNVFRMYMELMPVGSFERRAHMFAHPTEIELFRVSFDSLRIQSVSDLFLRVGMNLGFSYRFKRVVEVLIQMQTRRQQNLLKKRQPVTLEPTTLLTFSGTSSGWQVCQKSVPRSTALLFVAYSVGVIVVTHQCIATSQKVCKPHPQCVVFAYRWRDTTLCPCRALVDGDRAPKTYHEWTNPVDATNTVRVLAAAGTLKTFQLINRQLTFLPEELRLCESLHFISIVNCAIEEIPIWAKEFHNLEYLQIEGKVGSANLADLPSDLFSEMPHLRYIQLGLHQRMTRLPPLDGVPSLCCLILARMSGITELPSFAHVTELERLEFAVMKQLRWLPGLATVGPIVHLAVYQGASLCCNGFLGTCDLKNPFCKAATCLEDASLRATPATLQVVAKFSSGVCQPYEGVSQTPTTETIQMCEGVPFRQCQLPGLEPNTTVVGMCYNHRMQVLACNPDPAKIQVRMRQIEEGVGDPCDPVEEAWLGCKATNNQQI